MLSTILAISPSVHIHFSSTISIDIDAHWLCHADSIRNLHQHFIANTGSHQVLGNMTCSISCRTVNFGGIFTAESTTTVCTFTTISIYNDFAAG